MASAVPMIDGAYCLTTWNSQGSPKAMDKQAILRGLIVAGKSNIVFLQEAGGERIVLPGYDAHVGDSVGAYGDRCTCQLLVPAGTSSAIALKAGDAIFATGGDAGRTAVAAAFGATLLISMHTTANATAADTVRLIDLLNRNPAYDPFQLVVIGADFNIAPDDLQVSLTAQMETRAAQGWPFSTALKRTGQKTQGGPGKDKRELDYFVVLTRRKPAYAFVAMAPVVLPVDRSDHNPVQIVCDLPPLPPRARMPTAARQTTKPAAPSVPAAEPKAQPKPRPRAPRRPG